MLLTPPRTSYQNLPRGWLHPTRFHATAGLSVLKMEESASALTSEDLHPGYLERSRKELSKKVEQLKRALAEVWPHTYVNNIHKSHTDHSTGE